MKISIFLLILLDVRLSKEQQTGSGEIVLKFDFPLLFDSFNKSCCKLFPRGCLIVMDNRGYVCSLLRGRVTRTERSGSIEFRITNAQFIDGGYYRCYVQGTQCVKDFLVEISEPSGILPHSPSSTFTTPLTLPTGSGLPQYRDRNPIAPWTFNMLLAVSVSVATVALIGFAAAVVCCRRKKSKNKVIESQTDSAQPKAEASSVVYTTVDFKPHRPPPLQLYANLERRDPAAKRSKDLHRSPETEYCTLALRR